MQCFLEIKHFGKRRSHPNMSENVFSDQLMFIPPKGQPGINKQISLNVFSSPDADQWEGPVWPLKPL